MSASAPTGGGGPAMVRRDSVLQRRLTLSDMVDLASFNEVVKSFVELYRVGIKVFDANNDGRMDILVTDMHSDMSEEIGPDREKLKSRMRWPSRTASSSSSGSSICAS